MNNSLFRNGVSAIIVNSDNEILLVNLLSFKSHFYALPGGGLEDNEQEIDAIYRELHEELGIQKTSLELVGTCKDPITFRFQTKKLSRNGTEYDGSRRYCFGFKFTGSNSEIMTSSDEVRSYLWSPYSMLNKYLLFDNQLQESQEKTLELFPTADKL